MEIEIASEFIQECICGNLDKVNELLDQKNVDIDYCNKNGWSPITFAASAGQYEIVKRLVEEGANDDYLHELGPTKDASLYLRNTPLHLACFKGHVVLVEYLLEIQYDINDSDPNGNRPLHLAASGGHRHVVELLLAHQADTGVKNKFKNTPMDVCPDPLVRKMIQQAITQKECTGCHVKFELAIRGVMCQHCQNIFCDQGNCTERISKLVELEGGFQVKQSVRRCQDCIMNMQKTQALLESTMQAKIEQIEGKEEEDQIREADPVNDDENKDGEENKVEKQDQDNEETTDGEENRQSIDERKKSLPSISTEKAWSLQDVEPLHTAIENASGESVDPQLIAEAQKVYERLYATIKVQTSIQDLVSESPIKLSRQLLPLQRAIAKGEALNVHSAHLIKARIAICRAEHEISLSGLYHILSSVEYGTDRYTRDMEKLQFAIEAGQKVECSESLLQPAIQLHERLTSEIAIRDLLLPVKEVTDNGKTHFFLGDGTKFASKLKAIDAQMKRLLAFMENPIESIYITQRLEEAEPLIKKLKKEYKEEYKRNEERKKEQEELALKAAKKKQKGKKK